MVASNLGWLFDGYEAYPLVLSVGMALKQLLDPARAAQAPVYAGAVMALTVHMPATAVAALLALVMGMRRMRSSPAWRAISMEGDSPPERSEV